MNSNIKANRQPTCHLFVLSYLGIRTATLSYSLYGRYCCCYRGHSTFFSISFLSSSFFSKGLYLKDKTKEHQQKVQTEIVKLVFLLWIAGGKKENKLLKNIWYKSVSALCISIKTKWIIVVIISATSFTVYVSMAGISEFVRCIHPITQVFKS